MLRSNNNCNNCGKQGHMFVNCKMPIISFGLIVFKMTDEGLKYLMIQRRHTFGYIDFIRGKYIINNIEYIDKLFNEMSIYEKIDISTKSFETLWNDMWGACPTSISFKNEELMSQKKFNSLKNGININDEIITLNTLILNSTTNWEGPEWEFPKGRRNYQEKEIDCALREFEEETGYPSVCLNVVENMLPFDEIFIGSNHKSYKHKYFLANMSSEELNITPKYQITEVSDVKWLTLDECLHCMRPYNIEKQQIIRNISKILTSYKLV